MMEFIEHQTLGESFVRRYPARILPTAREREEWDRVIAHQGKMLSDHIDGEVMKTHRERKSVSRASYSLR